MYHERLITGVAAVLGAIAVVLAIVGVAGSPIAFPVAIAFAAAAILMYDQLSGRMAARVYRRVEQHARVADADRGDGGNRRRRRAQRASSGRARGGFGAGPREDWTPPRDGATVGEAAGASRRQNARRSRQRGSHRGSNGRQNGAGTTSARKRSDGPSATAAYRRLGVEPGADEETITAAYRRKVKEVHPDTPTGDEETFMKVKAAYERLTD